MILDCFNLNRIENDQNMYITVLGFQRFKQIYHKALGNEIKGKINQLEPYHT